MLMGLVCSDGRGNHQVTVFGLAKTVPLDLEGRLWPISDLPCAPAAPMDREGGATQSKGTGPASSSDGVVAIRHGPPREARTRNANGKLLCENRPPFGSDWIESWVLEREQGHCVAGRKGLDDKTSVQSCAESLWPHPRSEAKPKKVGVVPAARRWPCSREEDGRPTGGARVSQTRDIN